MLTFTSCNRCGFRIGAVTTFLVIIHRLNFISRRAREKIQACKYTVTKHATANWPNSNGAQSTVTSSSPPSAANWPNSNRAQSTVTSSSPSSAYTPACSDSLDSLVIPNRTFFHCAENKPSNAPIPLSSTPSCALPHARSGAETSDLGLGLEDVSSICYGPLPVTNSPSQRTQYISLDPLTWRQRDSFADGCHPSQQLTLNHDYNANAEVSSIQLSHSHSESTHYRHADMSAVAQCGPFTSFPNVRWVDDLGTPLFPFAYHTIPEPQLASQPDPELLPMPSAQFGAISSTHPISSLGAVDHEHNSSGLKPLYGGTPSPLYQTYPLAFTSITSCEMSVNNPCSSGSTIVDRLRKNQLTRLQYIASVAGIALSRPLFYSSL
jgi:hypothetical protein